MSFRLLTAVGLPVLLLLLFLAGCKHKKNDNEDTDTNPPRTGVLFLGVGTTSEFSMRWADQFFHNLYDYFPPGFMAGGHLEGEDCYTLIHYANEVESSVCGVAEGTPIDAFCNEYEITETYPLESLDQAQFLDECYNDVVPFFLLSEHSTVHPVSGEEIVAPVVRDPDAPGNGVADFIEMAGFARMEFFASVPGGVEPHRDQLLAWWYNDIAPALEAAEPGTEFVFRHGWESFLTNTDMHGEPFMWQDSAQTALQEMIEDESVERIVVFSSYPEFSNTTQYGHDWYDGEGRGVSAASGQTFAGCVMDLDNGKGPTSPEALDAYLAHKPWGDHDLHPFPAIREMAFAINPDVTVTFATPYGAFDAFSDSVMAMVDYSAAKFGIPRDSSLKVILAHHGYDAGYADAQECDIYNGQAEVAFDRVAEDFGSRYEWEGRFELVHGAGEYAEHENPMAPVDPVSELNPFGLVASVAEEVEKGINGFYVNQLGQLVDNGTDNFDYIVVVPYYFESESSDTFEKRPQVFGNNVPHNLDPTVFVRDELDADGTPYDADDYDDEFYTLKAMDGTGWPGLPAGATDPVNKGSDLSPTQVLITPAFLSLADGGGLRGLQTEAAVLAIGAGLDSPHDGLCEACTACPEGMERCLTVTVYNRFDENPGDAVLWVSAYGEDDSTGWTIPAAFASTTSAEFGDAYDVVLDLSDVSEETLYLAAMLSESPIPVDGIPFEVFTDKDAGAMGTPVHVAPTGNTHLQAPIRLEGNNIYGQTPGECTGTCLQVTVANTSVADPGDALIWLGVYDAPDSSGWAIPVASASSTAAVQDTEYTLTVNVDGLGGTDAWFAVLMTPTGIPVDGMPYVVYDGLAPGATTATPFPLTADETNVVPGTISLDGTLLYAAP